MRELRLWWRVRAADWRLVLTDLRMGVWDCWQWLTVKHQPQDPWHPPHRH